MHAWVLVCNCSSTRAAWERGKHLLSLLPAPIRKLGSVCICSQLVHTPTAIPPALPVKKSTTASACPTTLSLLLLHPRRSFFPSSLPVLRGAHAFRLQPPCPLQPLVQLRKQQLQPLRGCRQGRIPPIPMPCPCPCPSSLIYLLFFRSLGDFFLHLSSCFLSPFHLLLLLAFFPHAFSLGFANQGTLCAMLPPPPAPGELTWQCKARSFPRGRGHFLPGSAIKSRIPA